MKVAAARARNKTYYRVLHVPLWIYVFFTLPGALTAELYASGFHRSQWLWLAVVTAVCAWRGALGRLPGTESKPYITHYGLDWPNLGYRVACYTAAWIAIVAPWLLNAIGLGIAVTTGRWAIRPLYGWPYDLIALGVVALAALDRLPRTRRSIRGEGSERAWFYVGVWTAVLSQLAGLLMWRLGHPTPAARALVFFATSAVVLGLGFSGRLPRTRRYYDMREAERE